MMDDFTKCDNYINGEFIAPISGEYFPVVSPCTADIIGQVALSNEEDVKAAVQAAQEALPLWYVKQ
jgi:acyl-CoA reductase-like NAD-dependent aldehyde dehydrogenase